MEPSRATSQKGEVATISISTQQTREPVRDSGSGECSSKAPVRYDQCYFATPERTSSHLSRVMSVARSLAKNSNSEPKRARLEIRPSLSFSDEDKIGTIQPHDDALVVTLRIGEYDVKRVMVDQGSCIKIMYLDLYRGLKLKPEDLTAYDSPLVSFNKKLVTPKGQIRLPL